MKVLRLQSKQNQGLGFLTPIGVLETDEADVIVLTRQHGCSEGCRYPFIKKGAIKSRNKMIKTLEEKINENRSSIRFAEIQIKRAKEGIDKINAGDMSVHI